MALTIEVKKVPDSDIAGDLDPRVLEVTMEQMKKFASFPKLEAKDGDIAGFPIERVRAMMGWPNLDITTTAIAWSERKVPGRGGDITVRIYTPAVVGSKPAVVFFHGGGFIGGTIQAVENPCKYLAEHAGAVVVNVDYRLAPEHPFPAGLHDCYDAVKWVYENAEEIQVDRERITVAGDSAGGNLAAVCAIMDRDLGNGMIKYQALIYPTVNMAGMETDDFKWTIHEYEINHNHELIRGIVHALGEGKLDTLYLQGKAEVSDPYVSPLLADDLSGLPPALIIEAEYDYLRLEGEAYGRKLVRSGVPTRMIRYSGMDHAFMDKIGLYPQAEDCMKEIAAGIRETFKSN
ncbi:alpha/beta hydrolase [Paenibacillus sp. sgz302251]|uniref:alpha/beta hydrolase n=1 Tax=Paenibacillus sp. sgz302251 TaxID=3414493 RepID=UPI003C7BC76F